MASSTMDLYDHSFYPFSIIHADIKKAEFVMSHKELLFPNVPTREKKVLTIIKLCDYIKIENILHLYYLIQIFII